MPETEHRTKRKVRSYSRDELRAAVREGARCVTFHYCFSLMHTIEGETDILVVRGWLDGVRTGFWHTLGTALFGWWGLHGIYLTPYYLFLNLTGGRDLTQQVLATLESDAMSKLLVAPEFKQLKADAARDIQSPGDFLKSLEEKNRSQSSEA
jgi:hypothetical protein